MRHDDFEKTTFRWQSAGQFAMGDFGRGDAAR
jgi:hypothetical protein